MSRARTLGSKLRLEKYFGVSAQFWMNLQSRYDLKVAPADKLALDRLSSPNAANSFDGLTVFDTPLEGRHLRLTTATSPLTS